MLLFHRRSSGIAETAANLHVLLEDLPIIADVEEVYRMVVSRPMIVGLVMFSSPRWRHRRRASIRRTSRVGEQHHERWTSG
jgi:hypothetical protein